MQQTIKKIIFILQPIFSITDVVCGIWVSQTKKQQCKMKKYDNDDENGFFLFLPTLVRYHILAA